ncbi:MAG: ABC transporter permease [Chloroflexia bacterium]|nr:ABC transporter permease [Chloroflexia bacterium]
MQAIQVAWKDIQIILRDRGTLLNMFLLPLVFIVVLSTAMSAMMGSGDDSRISLPVVNLDPDGEMSQALIQGLEEDGGVQVQSYEYEEALERLQEQSIARFLLIPEDMAADFAAGRPVTLRLLVHPESSETTTGSVQRVVSGLAMDISMQSQLIASFEQMGDMLTLAPPEYQVFSKERIIAQAESQFERSKTDPLIQLRKTTPSRLGDRIAEPTAVQQNVPGYAVVFAFLTAQATAYSIWRERREGTFRRLMAAPMSKGAMLLGKMLPNFISALIQLAVIFGVSVLLLPLLGLERMRLGQDMPAFVLLSLLLALCSTGMGLLIAAIARTEAQIGGYSALALWTMGAVGGCLFPPFLLGGVLDIVGRVVPHYWAIQAYQDLIVRGRGLADITTELLVLLGFSLLFFAVGLWQFEFDPSGSPLLRLQKRRGSSEQGGQK